MTPPKITNDDKMTGLVFDKITYEKATEGRPHKYTFQFVRPGTNKRIDVVYRVDDYLDQYNFKYVGLTITKAFETEQDGLFTYFYIFGESILCFTSPKSNITFQSDCAQVDSGFWKNYQQVFLGASNYESQGIKIPV